MREKPFPTKSLRDTSGPVVAREKDVFKAAAINALLTRPIAILPGKVSDPIRPFALGLWNDIRCLLKPEISVSTLRKAIGAYVYSRSYQVAIARPGSVRHDVNGAPVASVSHADRLDAQQKYESLRTGDGSRNTKAASPLARPTSLSKAGMIRGVDTKE
ncbi:ProQ/FINO family protein [Ensifer sp. LC163]|uniref:ProQ/FINO family protein n=1 Tax=Ensifer sp. LC163 TaxID=1120652 RepID=UPI000813CBC0|nr:ProQ/FINO family protein [Ensifer sp. LC163]OCP36175.1 hypothetical protein BC360_24970 [Ensifer sp. LC163]